MRHLPRRLYLRGCHDRTGNHRRLTMGCKGKGGKKKGKGKGKGGK
jgi:hypothetical protein